MENRPAAKHILHSGYFHPVLRSWQCPNTTVRAESLMLPLFIIDSDDEVQEIPSMPGVFRFGINKLKAFLQPVVDDGLKSVLLFGVPQNLPKDGQGTNADSSVTPVIRVIPKLRDWFPNLVIACDVCLCAYTDHGHCGLIDSEGFLDNQASIERIARQAVNYAKAGAHIVAPSDMMDGRIGAIKRGLTEAGLGSRVSVLSYAAKFASAMYGPFRDAAQSAPGKGDRRGYQLPPGSAGLAARATLRDVEEGADMLMVKPGLSYLDIVRQTKDKHPEYPLFIYQVSGEYSMLIHAAKNGVFQLQPAVEEVLLSMRRAGADVIISYFTPQVLKWIKEAQN
ncbi:delta-aminolevulinic acid dehydratase [Neocloeon triangulifer]|uniref:delta-aminolevulinic acid dehydratase n=1 Tax=Neocloeon triangulifer TaxID=2078957 RepID=UPI00286EEC72|nr:delta-aminolevulinic acid dehydratase [Neocloeon triangulifer]